jgi:regulator of protease activity HflC (stomatin/prohibitin superfamily)
MNANDKTKRTGKTGKFRVMMPREVTERVEEIRELAGDYEAAHSREDQLHQDVLRAIATGRYDAKFAAQLAAEALKTTEIDFPRPCA